MSGHPNATEKLSKAERMEELARLGKEARMVGEHGIKGAGPEEPKLGQVSAQLNDMEQRIKVLLEIDAELGRQLLSVTNGNTEVAGKTPEDPGPLVPFAQTLFDHNVTLDSLADSLLSTIQSLEL